MKQLLSKITIFSIVFIFTVIPAVSFVYAQGPGVIASPNLPSGAFRQGMGGGGGGGGSDYVPITPGYKTFFEGANDLGGMLARLFEISITLTIVLAVLMMIIGGVQYMGNESIFKKDEGKQRIYAAIGGLLIALVSILIISTILPGGNGDTFEIDIFG